MKKKIISIVRNLIFLGIGIFLVWWQLGKMSDAQEVQFKESLLHAKYIYIIPVVLMALLSHLSRALRWRILIEPMGYRPKASNTFYATLCGYFANNFVPRAGEVLRCTLLSKYENIPVTKLIGTVILERVFDFITYLFIILITFLIQVKTVSNFVKEKFTFFSGNNRTPWLKYVIILLVLFGIWLGIKFVFTKYNKKTFHSKAHQLLGRIKGGVYFNYAFEEKKIISCSHHFYVEHVSFTNIYWFPGVVTNGSSRYWCCFQRSYIIYSGHDRFPRRDRRFSGCRTAGFINL
jgi:hypothetical protein